MPPKLISGLIGERGQVRLGFESLCERQIACARHRLAHEAHGRQAIAVLDLTFFLKGAAPDAAELDATIAAAARARPWLLGATEDPIVSSDVLGCSQSVLFDRPATMVCGEHLVKLLGWHETLGHAARILELARGYLDLELGRREVA